MSDAWSYVPLADVAHIKMGQSPPSATVNDHGSGVPFLQGNAQFGSRHPVPTKFCTKPEKLARSGDILLSVRAPVGAVNLADKEVCIGRGLSAITANAVDPGFLWYAIGKQVAGLTPVAQGSTFAAVKRADLCTLAIPLPTRPEQRKIASILSSVDETIERTEAIVDQVKVIKRGLMAELLTRGIPRSHTRFRPTEIGSVPADWRVRPLGECLKEGPDNGLYRPQTDYGTGTPIIRIDAFNNGDVLRRPSLRRVSIEPRAAARFRVKPGDILVNRVNSLSHLAKCALAGSFDEPTVYESNIMRLSVDDSRLMSQFGFLWLSSERVKRHLRRNAKRAVAQASVNQNDVVTIPTPCPPWDEQRRIVQIGAGLDQRLESESRALAALRELKSALMSVLLTGELRVTPDPEAE